MIPAPIDSRAAYRSLQPGDPWTMILDAPIPPLKNDKPVGVGDIITKWFATNERRRMFKVTAVHGFTYETIFIGFEPPPGEASPPVEPPRPTPPRPNALAATR